MRTTGGKLVALLLLAGLGVGGYFAWKSGWFASLTNPDSKEKKGTEPSKQDPPEVAARKKLLATFGTTDDKKPNKAATDETESLGKADVVKLADDLKEGEGGSYTVNPFARLGKEPSALNELFPGSRLPVKDALAARVYLALWHDHLVALRAGAREAKLPDISKKLPNQALTLRMLADFAENPAFKALDGSPKSPTPGLPWFTAADQETANLLQTLFTKSTGWDFAADRLAVEQPKKVPPEKNVRAVLVALGKKELLTQVDKAFAAERLEVVKQNVVTDPAPLSRVYTAVNDLISDLERGLKLPKPGAP